MEALKAGADLSIAAMRSAGRSLGELTGRAEKWLGHAGRSAVESLLRFGIAESDAAKRLMIGDWEARDWLRNVPIQPHLFGDDPHGDRVAVGITFNDPRDKGIIDVYFRDAGGKSLQQLIDEEVERAKKIVRDYKGRFRDGAEALINSGDIEIIYAARRF